MDTIAKKGFSTTKYSYTFTFFTVLLLCYFAFFWQLDAIPALLWDESRQLVTAHEMLQNNNYFVTYFNGEPDLWNSKPPLLIWLIALSYKLFGFNLAAARLPSAFSGAILCCVLYFIFAVKYKRPWLGLLIVAILCSTPGYVSLHVTRTADYDGLLVLFVFLFSYHFYNFTETGRGHYMLYTALFFAAAVMTKGIAALIIAPGILLYLIIQKRLVFVLQNRWFYIWGFTALALPISYYLYRESLSVGYLHAISANELGGRYNNALEGNTGEWYYYLVNFGARGRFLAGMFLYIPFTIVALVYNGPFKKLSLYSVIISVCYFTTLSISKTKLWHYDAQAYPFMVITIAIGIYYSIGILSKKNLAGKLGIAAIALALGYLVIHDGVNSLNGMFSYYYGDLVNYGNTFSQLEKNHPNIKTVRIYYWEYNSSALFYEKYYSSRGFKIKTASVPDKNFAEKSLYAPGDTLMICNTTQLNYLKTHYSTQTITQNHGCEVLVLNRFN